MNLFEQFPDEPKSQIYNKDHFNSFSGVGAKSSHIDFDSIWNEEKAKKTEQKKDHFQDFNTIHQINFPKNQPVSQQLPSYPINTPQQFPAQQNPYFPQQHVTMNINMNMYPNVMNVNVSGNQNQVPQNPYNPPNQANLSQPITL